ncbi:MAG: choice-of-anchor tandem repeat GloVer-containing protein, partial [Candidatus Sulfotelmatobacter sp.]
MASTSPLLGWNSRIYLCLACVLMACAVVPVPAVVQAQAQTKSSGTFSVLYNFKNANGQYPLAGVIVDSSGTLYGTTSEGGAYSYGTVYKVTESGDETVLHSFKGGPSDGRFPIASLVRDAEGNLYGTTTMGGAASFGTVFRLAENGDETLLHSFGASKHDGRYPSAGLAFGPDGSLYGTTQEGGDFGFGTIFKVEKNGEETVLHSFAGNPSDGQYPIASLAQDAKGNFYGTTELGGASNDGTVFKLDEKGNQTVLLSFPGGKEGANPFGGVVLDSAGNMYGTTAYGGHGVGIVFKIDDAGAETVLYTFNGGSDGLFPSAGLVRDSKGNLYGTAEFGGVDGAGAVFEVSKPGTEIVLHSFNGSDGADLL